MKEGANLRGLRSVVGGGEKEDLQRIEREVSGTLYTFYSQMQITSGTQAEAYITEA